MDARSDANANVCGGYTVIFAQHFYTLGGYFRYASPPARVDCTDGNYLSILFGFKKDRNAIGSLDAKCHALAIGDIAVCTVNSVADEISLSAIAFIYLADDVRVYLRQRNYIFRVKTHIICKNFKVF